MKFKKIMLITLLLLAVLTIGAVSASDDVASDDLAVSDDGDSIESPVDDADLLSDDGDEGGNDDGGDGEGDDENPYQPNFVNEFNVSDENEVVVSFYCPNETEGFVSFNVFDEDEKCVSDYLYEIKENDYDTFINITSGNLKINKPGEYFISAYLLENADDDIEDGEFLFDNDDDGPVYAIDYTQFRFIEYGGEFSLIFRGNIFAVYCPDGKVGLVTVSVRKGDDGDAIKYNKSISEKDDSNCLYWNLSELGISETGQYFTNAYDNEGNEIIKGFTYKIESPIYFEEFSYINSTTYGMMVVFQIPIEFTDGNITLSIDEKEIFNHGFDYFVDGDEFGFDNPFWLSDEYNGHWYKYYIICNYHEGYQFEAGNVTISATLQLDGVDLISDVGTVTLIDRNLVNDNNVTIEIFDAYEYDLDLDMDSPIIEITVSGDIEGYVKISVPDEDWEWNCTFDELPGSNGFYAVMVNIFEEFEPGEYEITVACYDNNDDLLVNNTALITFCKEDDDDEDDDAEDGVIIWVENGDDRTFSLDDDLDEVFCVVSVEDTLDGSIVITGLVYDDELDEDIETILFNKDLSEIENNEPDEELDGFTRYMIKLNDLDYLDDLKNQERILVEFYSDEDDDSIDSREYNVDYDDEDNEIGFFEVDDDEYGGEPIDAEFYNANILTNDVVVRISVGDLLFADDEFEVYMDGDDPIQLNLNEIESDGDYYYIRVSDLFSEEELDDETTTIFSIYIQFYSDGEEAYYAELDDDEIYIYVSPYISSEAYFFMDDCVITFTPLENQDDEFKVTISKDGADDIVKTFKVSDFVGPDDDYPFYDITLSDLNITDAGEYHISVNFTKDGKELVFNEGNVTVGNVNIRYPDEEADNFTDVAGDVATIRVPDDFEGSILLDLDGNQSEIPLSDLNYNYWPSNLGRQILLNDLKITQDGVHTLKLQVYDKDGNPLLNEPLEFGISVQTGENTVEFIGNNTYGAEIGDVMDFKIGTPIPDDAYYIIYLNGKKAGNYTLRNGIVISDEFTDPFFDIDLLKVGVYKVNVTYFDGKNVTDFGQGSFTISSLDMTCDKTEYVVGNKVRVSFKAPDPNKVNYRIDAYRVDEAGPAGWNEQMLFNPYFSEDIIRDGLWKDDIITLEFEFDEAGTYYLHVTNRINPDKHGGEDEIIADIIEINVGKPIDPNLTISIADITVGESAVVKVTTNSAFSGNVTVQIANKNYTVSVVNGTGSISVPGLAAGSYTATAFFAATGMFNASTKATTFKVNDKKADEIKLALKKVKVKRSAKKLILKATLKINGKAANKKVVIFKFNKKTYKAKTNKKGVAKVKIGKKVLRKLKVGKKVKIQASYAGVVKKLTVKVKK